MRGLSVLLLGVWLNAIAPAASVAVHKCVGKDGRLVFQQTPCPPGQRSEVLAVEGDIDPARKAAADAIAAANAPAPIVEAPSAPPPARNPRPAPVAKKRVVCPPTRENPGRIPVVVTNDPITLAIARDYYRNLPSKTTLKNNGDWPDECGD